VPAAPEPRVTHRARPVTPAIAARSGLFAACMVLSTVVFAVLALLVAPLPYRARYRFITLWTRLNLAALRVTCGVAHHIEGRENVPDRPAVVLCKHESAWETLALQLVFSPQVWVLKRELLRIPFFGWGLALLRPIAIDRGAGRRAVEQVIEGGRRRLAEGCWVVVFPEGTRVAPGTRRRYRVGGAALAERAGTPVVPVAHNAGDFWPRRSFIKWPGTVRMVIGPPIESTGRTAAEINRLAESWIEERTARIRAAGAAPLDAHREPRPDVSSGGVGGTP